MANPDRQNHPKTSRSGQYIQNSGFDEVFQVPVAELVAYNAATQALDRVQINSDGELLTNASVTGAAGGTSAADDADFTAGTTAGTPAMGVYESAPTTVTDGDVGVVGITANRELKVSVTSGGTSGTQYTEGDTDASITGTALMMEGAADALVVATGTAANGLDVDVTRVSGTVTVDGSGSTQPVSAASLPLPTGAATSANQTTIIGHVDGIETTLGTIDTDTGNIATNTTDMPNVIGTDGAAGPSKAVSIGGTDGSGNLQEVRTDTDGHLQVDVLSGGGGGTQYTSGDVTAATPTGTMPVFDNGGTIASVSDTAPLPVLATTGTDALDVIITNDSHGLATEATLTSVLSDTTSLATAVNSDGTVAGGGVLLVAGTDGTNAEAISTNASGHVNIADGGNSITIDGTITANLSATDNAVLDAIEADTTTIAGAVSGTEMQVDIVGALPAGTNAIGKLSANSGVDIGDVDVTSLPALAAGTNYIGKISPPDVDVTTHTNYAKKYYSSTGAATDGIIWSPAAGKRWHVVSMFINVSAAATVTLEDDKAGGDEAVMKMELAANSGTVINFGEKYPLASGEDAADLIITTSAGNVYVTCTGYEV